MKNLEKKIQENISEIFYYKPESGHRQRFEQKLTEQQKIKKMYRLSWLKYAVAAAIITIAFFVFAPQISENKNTTWQDIHIVEVERYYAMQLDDEIRATKQLLQNIDEQCRNELLRDIKLMQSDQNNIPTALDDEKKVAVIVLTYTRKIESLQNLQSNILAYNKP